MIETKDHGQYKDLEEGDEGVRGGGPTEDKGKEGGETSVEDGRADLLQAVDGPLQPGPRAHHEAVADVDTVVDTETDRDDDVDAGHDVDGDVPEVEIANNVDQSDAMKLT